MSEVERRSSGPPPVRRTWIRAGQILGLTALIGPLSDLANASLSAAQVVAIAVALVAFVALYLVLLPPARGLERRGRRAVRGALALFAVLAVLPLALGAPRSFALLFVYVVAAGSLLLPPRLAVPGFTIAAAAVGVGLAVAGSDASTVAAYALTVLAVGAVMAALGTLVRANRELRAAREELARSAVSEERLRIARDLHDLLAHTLSLIALKSELAAKLVQTDPVRAQAELDEVQEVTRQALREVREAVRGYRRRSSAEALENARATLTAAGIECRVDVSDAELPPDVESVIAWALREASTNVVRHSGARACAITLASDSEVVSLQVVDDGRSGRAGYSEGSGLAGLAERARRLHGKLETGVQPEGGFRLRLTLPLRTA
jgi:two-component system, NarL family, sensor histidine kinase DesK